MHEFIEIDGMNILVTDDPVFTKSTRYKRRGLYMCYVKQAGRWAKIDVSVEAFNDEGFRKYIPKKLREELNSIGEKE